MNKKVFIITFFSSIFLLISLALYLNVSTEKPHRDLDSGGYEEKALLFYKTGSLAPVHTKTPPLVQQPLGYPLFMGIIYKTFGTQDIFLIWAQILLTLLSALILFFATRHLFGNTTALIAHAFFCLNIGYITFAQFILAEALLAFFLMLFFERFSYFIKTKKKYSLGLAGLALGSSSLIKPAALYYFLPLLLILIPFVFTLKRFSAIKKAFFLALFTSCFFVPVKSYQLYNYLTYGIANFGALGNYNLYVWFWSKVATDQQTPETTSHRNKIFSQEKQSRTSMITGNPLQSESWDRLGQAFWKSARENPSLFIKTWIREMIKTYAGLYSTNLKVLVENKTKGGDVSFFYNKGSFPNKIYHYITQGTDSTIIKATSFLETIWNILRYILVLFALLWLLIKEKWFLLSFFTSYIFYFSLVTGFDGCARYRTMFEFLLITLASLGISVLFLHKGTCREKQG
ncbi:glycosyltransferase family 39 protein [Candidatus Dependentiae bacterium]|nr:glycosyltransferase family 39 protein [Candidatus Dependentiae bacterium]